MTKILRIAAVGAGYFSQFHLDAWSRIEGVRVADEAGILLVVHENFRFMPWFRHARRLVEAGRLAGDGQGPEAYLDRQPYSIAFAAALPFGGTDV